MSRRNITGRTRIAAVVGSPVGSSLSPAIHNAAFRSYGIDWRMVAFDVDPGADIIAAMRTFGIAGLAVTMPHKAAVAAAVDEVDEAARNLDSVNTVVRRGDGSTFGTSTDGAGFVASLVNAGHDPAGRRVAILGAGGAARSIVDALGRSGAAEIVVVNRTAERAVAAAAISPLARVGADAEVGDADIIVNTTSVGMNTDELPLDPTVLRPHHVVADIVYKPLQTQLLAAAAEAGSAVVDGLGMLIEQARLQQRLWVGILPDAGPMRAAAVAELNAGAATRAR